jgi:hypothetical protein
MELMSTIPPYVFWPVSIAALVLFWYGCERLATWLSSRREDRIVRRRLRKYEPHPQYWRGVTYRGPAPPWPKNPPRPR